MSEFFLGKINVYDTEKGFGFIRRLRGRDVFFTIDDIENFDLNNNSIRLNQDVSFEITKVKKKTKAINIQLLDEV